MLGLDIEFLKTIPEKQSEIMQEVSRMRLSSSSKILMAYLLNHRWADEKYLFLPMMKYWRDLSKIPAFSYAVKQLVEKKCVGKCMIGQIRVMYPLNIIKIKAS